MDPRRVNLSEESLTANVERLKEYQKRLILFPRRSGKQKKGDASTADVKAVKEGKINLLNKPSSVFPDVNKQAKQVTEEKVKGQQSEENAFRKLRVARSDARLVGVREKRAKIKAEQAEATKK